MTRPFPEKTHQSYRTFSKKVQQGYRTFLKLPGKVIGLFEKSSPELPDFPEKRAAKTHLSTSDRVRDFTGRSGKSRQSYRTFLKLSSKVIGLFEKSSPGLPVFSKKVRQGYRSFRKMAGNVIRLFRKVYGPAICS